jgi:hypothetical protein
MTKTTISLETQRIESTNIIIEPLLVAPIAKWYNIPTPGEMP